MDYARPALADRLAADYVVGTLRGAARRRFESLVPAHALLREAMLAWQERLMPLTASLAPVQPSADVWRRIVTRIGAEGVGKAQERPGFWHRLGAWRAFSAVATVAAIALGVLLANPGPAATPIIVVLAATDAAPGGAGPASLVASIGGDGKTLVTREIRQVAAQPDRALELWAVPPGGAPRSLGLLPQDGQGSIALRGSAIKGTDTLAVSVEPPRGSTTGAPSGPVIYAGKVSP